MLSRLLKCHIKGGINGTLEAIFWGPNGLLDVDNLANAHAFCCILMPLVVPANADSFKLFPTSTQPEPGVPGQKSWHRLFECLESLLTTDCPLAGGVLLGMTACIELAGAS